MRVTTKQDSWVFLGVQNNNIRNDHRIAIHNNEVSNIFNKTSISDLKTGTYRLSSTGKVMTANQEARFLFSSVSQGEINQQAKGDNISALVRQLYKDSNWKIHLKETKEIDLDEDVKPEEVADELEQLTLFLADGDKEKLEELEKAFKKASNNIESNIPFDMKIMHGKIEKEVEERFKQLKESESLDTIETENYVNKDLDTKVYEKLYASVLAKPFEQMAPEITITLERTLTMAPKEPTTLCSESVCARLTEIARDILDQDIATVDELRSAFINGYKEGTGQGVQYRLQEATFYDMMDVFDELEKEYA